MRTALLLLIIFQAQMALAQFWPMQNSVPYNQVVPNYTGYPGYGNAGYGYGFGSVYGGPGYSVMPGRVMPPSPYFRQPPPYFQQPYNMYPYNVYGGGYGGYGPNPMMFPNQNMGAFGMNPFAGGMMGQPRTNLNLFLDLDRLFGGGGSNYGGPTGNGEPYCEYCESHRRSLDRIRVSDDYDRDYDRPTYTEARAPYVRQSENYPPPPPLPPQATQVPSNTGGEGTPIAVPGGGERIAGAEATIPPATTTAPAPVRVVREGKELPPAATLANNPSVVRDVPNPNPQGEVLYNVSARDKDERLAQTKPFFKLFMYHFNQCVPAGCEPAGYAIHREGADQISCHGVDQAIDVHAVVCNKDFRHPHTAIRQDPVFTQMVACMGGVSGGLSTHGRMSVIWQQNHGRGPTQDHWDHAHFSPKEGCTLNAKVFNRRTGTWQWKRMN